MSGPAEPQGIAEIESLLGPGATLGGDALSGPVIEIDRGGHRARISLFGGQLLAWQPAGHEPVIWLSPAAVFDRSTPIRGGIPVCWPWFGGHTQHNTWPSHGFARTTAWHLEGIDDGPPLRMRFRLPATAVHAAYWPYASRPCLAYEIAETLGLELGITNTDACPISFSQALHTYFSVGDISAVAIHGLEQCPYIDKLTAREESAVGEAIRFTAETDRIYRQLSGPIELRDARLERTITVSHGGSTNVIVWNPWVEKSARLDDMGSTHAYRGMVCIETGNVAPDMVSLAPGETHVLDTMISVREER